MVAVRRSVERAAAQLATAGTREQALGVLAGLGRAQLRAVARQLDVELSGADAKAAICRRLVAATVGARLDAAVRERPAGSADDVLVGLAAAAAVVSGSDGDARTAVPDAVALPGGWRIERVREDRRVRYDIYEPDGPTWEDGTAPPTLEVAYWPETGAIGWPTTSDGRHQVARALAAALCMAADERDRDHAPAHQPASATRSLDADASGVREPVATTVIAAGGLHGYLKAHGPVEVHTPGGAWWPCTRVESGRYGTYWVRYLADDGEWALRMDSGADLVEVRSASGTAVDPGRVAPAAGQSRVVPGVALRRYLGWQWYTPEGEWEAVTGAHQRYRWFVATESGRDWCEPECPVMVRPVADPVERVRGEADVDCTDVDCTCVWWADSPFVPGEATVSARYADAACPAHQPLAVPVATVSAVTPDGTAAAVITAAHMAQWQALTSYDGVGW